MDTKNFSQKLFSAFIEIIIILSAALLIAIVFNSIRSNNIPLFGFSSKALIKEQQEKIPTITLSESYDLYMKKKLVFIDARDPFSFEEGHISGAINIYPDEAYLHVPSLKVKSGQGFIFVTYCDGPQCPLSKETAHALTLRGFSNVKVLVNGWNVWLNAGYPISKGKI